LAEVGYPGEALTPRPDKFRGRLEKSRGRQAVVFLLFVAGYVALGMAGLQMQSAQAGVTPVWPASGFAFAMVYWFGLRQVIALLPAMLTLGWVLGLPAQVAVAAALGSMLEAALPVALLRRLGVDPNLRQLRDALLFVVLGAVMGPLFSATIGSLAMHWFNASSLDVLRLWLLWWLGNSLGLFLVGGLGLVAVAGRTRGLRSRSALSWLAAACIVALITLAGLLQVLHISSPLFILLLLPVFILVAQRGDQIGVLSLGVVAMAVMMGSAYWLPPESLRQSDLGILYLHVSLLWVVVFTGMMICSARQEVRMREQVSWLAHHDPLTRLPNRHAFMERLRGLLSDPVAERSARVLIYLDLDRFKDLNDAEGHQAGDRVMRDVSVLLAEEIRAGDQLARLGGDEFGVILDDCRLIDACSISENIRSAIEAYQYQGPQGTRRVEASVGLLELTPQHLSAEGVLHAAQTACNEAKRAGGNRVWVYSDAQSVDDP
jgi:diguanylate cyclase (GGDEF)-like protein